MSSRTRRTLIAVVVIVIALIGIIGYAVTGFSYAQSQVGSADKTLSVVISHRSSLDTTFKGIDASATGLSGANFDPKQARTVLDQFVANAHLSSTTIDQDDESLASARASLDEQQWLTVVSRAGIDKEVARIDHARRALSNAQTIAADYVQDGEFWQAFVDAYIDGVTVGTQIASADLAGARTTLATTKTQADKALQLSGAPGLPPELHALLVDFESLVADVGKLLDVVAAGDDATITSTETQLQTDANKVNSYDFAKIASETQAFYKPLVDGFNSEMAAATA